MKQQEQKRYHRQQNQSKNHSVVQVHGTLNIGADARGKSAARESTLQNKIAEEFRLPIVLSCSPPRML